MTEKKRALPVKLILERNPHNTSPKVTSILHKCKGKLQTLKSQVQNTLSSYQDSQESLHHLSSKEELNTALKIIEKLKSMLSKRQSVQLLNSLTHSLRKMQHKTREEYEAILKSITSLMQSLNYLDKDLPSILKQKQRLNFKGNSTHRSTIKNSFGSSGNKVIPKVFSSHRHTYSSKELNEDFKIPTSSSQIRNEPTFNFDQNKPNEKISIFDIDSSSFNEPTFIKKEEITCDRHWDINTLSKMTCSIIENSLGNVEYKTKLLENKVMNKLPSVFQMVRDKLEKKNIELNKYKTKSKLRNAIIRTLEMQIKTSIGNNNSDNLQNVAYYVDIRKGLMALAKKFKVFCYENEKILKQMIDKNMRYEDFYPHTFEKLNTFISKITDNLDASCKEGKYPRQNQHLMNNYKRENKNLISNLNVMLFSFDMVKIASEKVKQEIEDMAPHQAININELNKERTMEIGPNYLYTHSLKDKISDIVDSIVQVFNYQSKQINDLRNSHSSTTLEKIKGKCERYKHLYIQTKENYNLIKHKIKASQEIPRFSPEHVPEYSRNTSKNKKINGDTSTKNTNAIGDVSSKNTNTIEDISSKNTNTIEDVSSKNRKTIEGISSKHTNAIEDISRKKHLKCTNALHETENLTNSEEMKDLEDKIQGEMRRNSQVLESIQSLSEYKEELSVLFRDKKQNPEFTNYCRSFTADSNILNEQLACLIDQIENTRDSTNLKRCIILFFQKLGTLSQDIQDSVVPVMNSCL